MTGGWPACTVHFNILLLISQIPLTISQRVHNWPYKINFYFEGESDDRREFDPQNLNANMISISSCTTSHKGSTPRPENVRFEDLPGARSGLEPLLLTLSGTDPLAQELSG